MVVASEEMQKYFNQLESDFQKAYDLATLARKKGFDPEEKVDIPVARNMAERVQGLISVVAPQLMGSGMTKRILELEKQYVPGAWEVALLIAVEVAKEKFCKFEDKREAMEIGIRVGMAYSTSGIVAAPLEGFIELKIKNRKDGGEYFSIFYAGPIRGAGGTAASVSVLIADYVRKQMGYKPYDPSEEEVKRYVAEVTDYHERITNLQYFPSPDEIEFMIKNVPVEINGDPTEKIDVSNHKDLPRIETNRIRGGMCLVVAEGLCQKSPKLWKRLQKWGDTFELDWDFLEEFLSLQKKIKAKTKKGDEGERPKITPNYTYIKDLVAGRPVLGYPMRDGAFRLRYGRTRTSGFSAASIHPSAQLILNDYIAIGTQLKVERPGKACSITICDTIEPPIVKLENGDVIKLDSITEAKEKANKITEILFLGDILFNYGDFSENGHILVPPGYCEEWYVQELEKGIVDTFGTLDMERVASEVNISAEKIDNIFKNPTSHKISAEDSLSFCEKFKVPLHPVYTYYWKSLSDESFMNLLNMLKKAKIQKNEKIEKIIIPIEEKGKRTLEILGVPHIVATNEFVVIDKNHSLGLLASLGVSEGKPLQEQVESIITTISENPGLDTLDIINKVSYVKVRDKQGTFIGTRMGRPEKAKMRKLTGSPQVLFPVGEEGGRLRCFQSALDNGCVTGDFPMYKCNACNTETIYGRCETCGNKTTKLYECKSCGPKESETCPTHNTPCDSYKRRGIDIKYYFNSALSSINMTNYPDLIKGVKGTSNKDHIPEHLAKGVLRAKHEIFVNKDGTTRYDMTELPITHFKPKEIRTSIEKLKELGYTKDIKGRPIENPDQVVELKVQDMILPSNPASMDELSDDLLFNVGNFIDEMLVKLYGMEPFYNFRSKADLIGHQVIGLAPHISAATVGRIIGFSETQGMYTHPMFHAAMRRDCDGDEACVMLLLDALLNFSRQYLPNRRGAKTMDSPLVLTTILTPSEVDDQAHGIDVVWNYPLEFYDAAMNFKPPWDIKIEQIKHRLDTEKQYEQMGFTHNTNDINEGITCSAYKTLPSMEEKLKGQMNIAEKLRAVNESDVAGLVIEKHFLKDTKGNLRKFSMQQFRCVKCNAKYRRPPLVGKCTKLRCDGKIIFTIAEGSVLKYLGPSISLAEKYNVSPYLKQTLELLKMRTESVFGKDKEKQEGLGKWFG